jgi:hypothetical protein
MAYTMENFDRDYFIRHFPLLTPKEQREALQGVAPETLLAGLSDEQIRRYLARRERGRRCGPHAKSRGKTAMSIARRAELLVAIEELCRRYPEWRLGQLVANVAGWMDKDVWDIEDEDLLLAARLHLRHSPQPTQATADAPRDTPPAPTNK